MSYPPRSKYQCPVCRSWISVPLFTKEKIQHRRCNECHSIFTEPFCKIAPECYGKAYQSGYDNDDWALRSSKEWAEQIVDGAVRLYGKAHLIRLLEIGCSIGNTLQAMIDRVSDLNLEHVDQADLRVFGVDVSEYAIKKCQEQGFENTYVAEFPDLEKLVLEGTFRLPFDMVVMTHLLEHIPDVQEAWDVLSLIARAIFIHMPLADLEKGEDWIHFNPTTIGEHCVFYSEFGLRLMAQGHGFEIVDSGRTVDDYWCFAVNRRYGITRDLWDKTAVFM